MENKEVFYKIAENFKVFALCSEADVEYLKTIYKDKETLRQNIKNMIQCDDEKIKNKTKIELFCLLSEFCFNHEINNIEICALYSIFWDTLRLSFRKNSKTDVFNFYKNSLIKHAMNRPPYQINIFKKETIELVSLFFIDNIYKRFEFLKYLMSKKKEIVLNNKDIFEVSLPHILNLDLGSEILPRNAKILKQYSENRKPKSELEQKIDTVLEFVRENVMDKILEEKFAQQDGVFLKKMDEITKKRK
jgi:hypothetical protein